MNKYDSHLKENHFYENLLKNFLADESIKISSVVREDLVAKGNNFLSTLVKVICKGSKSMTENGIMEEPFQYEFVVKEKLTEGPLFMSISNDAFNNECIFYKDTLPALNRFTFRPISAPHCFFVSQDVIILENLSVHGLKCADKSTGIPLHFIPVVLKEIANLHAGSYVMHQKDPELYSKLLAKIHDFIFDSQLTNDSIYATQDQVLDLAIKLMESEKNEFLLDELKKLKGRSFDMQAQLIRSKRKCTKAVINHGDLWSNNIMLDVNNKTVKLLDFQAMRITSVAADLTYFLYVCTDPDIREENLRIFLETYLNELHCCLMQSGVDLRHELTLEWLMGEIKDFAFFGFMHAMWLLPLRLQENKDNTFEDYETDLNVGKLSLECRTRLLDLIHEYFSLVQTSS